MNVRWLIVIALLVAGIAVWFYQKQDNVVPSVSMVTSELDYEATNIQAVQTNEQGETEYQLDAKSLSFNPKTNQDEMSDITMNWQPVSDQHYRIKAGTATLNQQTGEMRLSGGFELMTQDLSIAASDKSNKIDTEINENASENNEHIDGAQAGKQNQENTANVGQNQNPSLMITGQMLRGNTKEQMVYSDEPVMVVQGLNSFKASAMQANLQTGEFEFSNIAVEFSPPERQDKPLF